LRLAYGGSKPMHTEAWKRCAALEAAQGVGAAVAALRGFQGYIVTFISLRRLLLHILARTAGAFALTTMLRYRLHLIEDQLFSADGVIVVATAERLRYSAVVPSAVVLCRAVWCAEGPYYPLRQRGHRGRRDTTLTNPKPPRADRGGLERRLRWDDGGRPHRQSAP
jgi:hypothetical protein